MGHIATMLPALIKLIYMKATGRTRLAITAIFAFMIISSPVFIVLNPIADVSAALTTNTNNVDTSNYHTTLPISEETSSHTASSTPTTQATLQIPRSFQSTDIVNSNGIYEITFITAATGNIKTVEIVFPAGTGIGPAGYIERVGIGPGFFSKAGTTMTYNVHTAETIPAGTFIRFELVNVRNPSDPSSTLQASITTKDTNGNVIDGPTSTAVYTVKQIGTGDIADNAVTTSKIAPDSIVPVVVQRVGPVEAVPPGATRLGDANCAAGEETVGGGYSIISSDGIKFLKVFRESRFDSSWRVGVFNTGTVDTHSFQPIAECMPALP